MHMQNRRTRERRKTKRVRLHVTAKIRMHKYWEQIDAKLWSTRGTNAIYSERRSNISHWWKTIAAFFFDFGNCLLIIGSTGSTVVGWYSLHHLGRNRLELNEKLGRHVFAVMMDRVDLDGEEIREESYVSISGMAEVQAVETSSTK